MRKLTGIIFLAALLALGCTQSQVLVNPETGQVARVSHTSWGWGLAGLAAAASASEAQKQAVADYKSMGFVEPDKVGTSGFDLAQKNDPLQPPVIGKVLPGSPAEQAGMKVGDVIMARNGREVKNVGEMLSQPKVKPGDITEWRLRREGRIVECSTVAVTVTQLLKKD